MVKPLTNPFLDAPLPLGSVITAAGRRLSGELDEALRAAGFADLRAAHAPVFMAIAPEGSRLTDVAQRARMTKQAAGELVRHLTGRGYLTSEPDPADGRARLILLTEHGWAAITTGQQAIRRFDRWLDDLLGADQVSRLRDALTLIAESEPGTR